MKKNSRDIKADGQKPFYKHWLFQFIIAPLIVGLILILVQQDWYSKNHTEQSAEIKDSPGSRITQVVGDLTVYPSDKPNICPTTTIELAQLADRAFWEWTTNWGDRAVYENLLKCQGQTENLEFKNEIMRQIKKIKDNYKTSILGPRVDALPAVCQRHTMVEDRCKIEPVEGFSATNVIEHLDIEKYPEAISRVRAVGILRNIKTSPDRNGRDIMLKALETLVFIMQGDPSLLVSKLALDRYSQFTSFHPADIFDFKAAIDDFENKKRQGQPILLPDYYFDEESTAKGTDTN